MRLVDPHSEDLVHLPSTDNEIFGHKGSYFDRRERGVRVRASERGSECANNVKENVLQNMLQVGSECKERKGERGTP